MKTKFTKTLAVVLALFMVFTTLPVIAFGETSEITTQETLNDAVKNAAENDVIQITAAGTYKVPAIPKNITIEATVDDVIFNCVGSGSIASIPKGATFKNVKFLMGSSGYHGFYEAGHIKMDNCTFEGLFFSYGDMTFTSCTFNQTASEYAMWCYAGNITYIDCIINCNGKFANVYNEGNGSWKIKAEGCTFNSTKVNKAAFNVKATCGAKILPFEVSISNCTANENFPKPSGDKTSTLVVLSPLVQVDDRTEAAIEEDVLSVSLDKQSVYPFTKPITIIIEADEENGITEEIANTISKNKDVKSFTDTGLEEALPEEYKDSELTIKTTLNAIVDNTLKFDVTPYADGVDISEEVKGNDITFRLPLTDNFTVCAKVNHEGEISYEEVKGNAGAKYIELTVNHFSDFEVTPLNTFPEATINDVSYDTLADAIVAANEDDTIVLVSDINLADTQLLLNKKVTLDLNGKTITGSNAQYLIGVTKDVTVTNGNIKSTSTASGPRAIFLIGGGATVNVDNVDLNSTNQCAQIASGEFIVNDGSKLTSGNMAINVRDGASAVINGGTITATTVAIYAANTNKDKVTNVTINGGTISGSTYALYLIGNTVYAELVDGVDSRDAYPVVCNVNDGSISSNAYGVYVCGKGVTYNMYDGELYARLIGIGGNGSYDVGGKFNGGTEVNVSGGTITADMCIFNPQYGNVTVSGGTLVGDGSGIEMRAGNLTVTGGTIICNNDELIWRASGSGNTVMGSAVIASQHVTKLPISINIKGGTLQANTPLVEMNPQQNDAESISKVNVTVEGGSFEVTHNGTSAVYTEDVTNFISGGSFSTQLPLEYCADGFRPANEADENGMFGVNTGSGIAKIIYDDSVSYFATLDAAVADAKEGDTILLIDDVDTDITLKAGIYFDLNNKSFTGKVLPCEGYHVVKNENKYSVEQHEEKDFVYENVVAATCTSKGSYDEVVYCNICNAEIQRKSFVVEMNPHQYKLIEMKPATCEEDGYVISRCKDCKIEKEETISAQGHKYLIVETELTCTADHTKTYTCISCNEVKVEIIEKASGHKSVTMDRIEPTCTTPGYEAWDECSVCHEILSEKKPINKIAHVDSNSDGICDTCGSDVKKDAEYNCNCFCHSNNSIWKLIYKVQRFFWKLFGMNQICECGKIHY